MSRNLVPRELTTEVVVGAFMVMILLGMGYFTIILSREAVFVKKYRVEVVFRDVMGLRNGDSVVVRGMPVGKVTELHLSSNGVHVVSMLDKPVQVRDGYRMSIVTASMLGGRYLNLDLGPDRGRPLPAKTVFDGETPYDIIADAAELVNAAKSGLVAGGVISNLQASARQLREIIDRVNAGQGTLGRLLSPDDTFYKDAAATVASLREISERIARGEGTAGKLVSADDQLYRDLSGAVTSLKTVAERLEKGEGTLGRLFSKDDQMYRDLADAVASLKAVASRLEKGEGTLGRFVADDTVYREVEGAVKEIRAAIDDMRQTSPLTTFSSIFFGAF